MNPRKAKKFKMIHTVRPKPDAAPVTCYRFGIVVIVESNGRKEVLTVEEARILAGNLLTAADEADGTPRTGTNGNRTYQLPDE